MLPGSHTHTHTGCRLLPHVKLPTSASGFRGSIPDDPTLLSCNCYSEIHCHWKWRWKPRSNSSSMNFPNLESPGLSSGVSKNSLNFIITPSTPTPQTTLGIDVAAAMGPSPSGLSPVETDSGNSSQATIFHDILHLRTFRW